MNESDEQKQWFDLLGDLQRELAGALNSLGEVQSGEILDTFRFNSASYINVAVDGYLSLRASRCVEPSRLLVRPAIETMIRLLGVRARPELLFRIVFHERVEYRKWFRPAFEKQSDAEFEGLDEQERQELKARTERERQEFEAADERALQDFKKRYHEQYPQHEMEEKDLSLWDVAQAAPGMVWYHQRIYRLYCSFAHASLQAMMGMLGRFEDHDLCEMSRCALVALEEVVEMKANVPQLSNLWQRFDELQEKMS